MTTQRMKDHLLEMVTFQEYKKAFPAGMPSKKVNFPLFIHDKKNYTVNVTQRGRKLNFMVMEGSEVYHMFTRDL